MTVVDSVRYARPDEVRLLEQLQRRASMAWAGYADRLAAIDDGVRISVAAVRDQRVRVATGGGTTLGFSTVVPADDDRCRLEALFVDPEWSGRGVGSRLLRDAEEVAADEGRAHLEVITDRSTVGFFEGAGYTGSDPVEAWCGTMVRLSRTL